MAIETAADRSTHNRDAELAELRDVGASLATGFGRLIRALPADARTVAAMSRYLGIGRTPCQRIALAVRAKGDPIRVIERFPGVQGVSQFLAAVEERDPDPRALRSARSAFERYAGLIAEAGGSQSRLMTHIQGHRERSADGSGGEPLVIGADELDGASRSMFVAARTLTRLASDARIELRFIRPTPDDPGMVDVLLAFVHVGLESGDGALALIRSRSTPSDRSAAMVTDDCSDLHRPLVPGVVGDVLLPAFSSDPFHRIDGHPRPLVTTRSTRARRIRVFNPDGPLPGRIDMAVANIRSRLCPHPSMMDPPTYGDNTTIRFPTRHLLIDVYLERSLAAQSIPSTAVLRSGEAQFSEACLDDCWYDTLAVDPPLTHLGRGVGCRPAAVYPRLQELSRHVLEAAGWDDTEFVGYRLDVPYPFWQTAYCIEFDFASGGV